MKSKRKKRKSRNRAAAREAAEARAASKALARSKSLQKKAERERKVALVLRSAQSDEDKFRQWSGCLHFALKRAIINRAPKLMDERFKEPLQRLNRYRWVRDLETWKPKGKSPRSLFRSLAKHLLVKYTIPAFMYDVFFGDEGVELFVHLGAGGSLYKAVKQGKFPVPLTKKMCHVFMQSTAKFGFVEAIRHAQVVVHGGDYRLASVIADTRQLGYQTLPTDAERFWDHVIQWTCNQSMLDTGRVQEIYDWLSHQYARDHGFSMKGRTGVSVLRAVETWHGELAKERKIHGHRYIPSGFDAYSYEKKSRCSSGDYQIEQHTISEILTSKQLAAEGRSLRHCVYSYSWNIQRGRVSIWSYRVNQERVLTIEVDNPTRRVVQVRGRYNRGATPSEMGMVERWIKANNLIRANYL